MAASIGDQLEAILNVVEKKETWETCQVAQGTSYQSDRVDLTSSHISNYCCEDKLKIFGVLDFHDLEERYYEERKEEQFMLHEKAHQSTILRKTSQSNFVLGISYDDLIESNVCPPQSLSTFPQEIRIVHLNSTVEDDARRFVLCEQALYSDMKDGAAYTFLPDAVFINYSVLPSSVKLLSVPRKATGPSGSVPLSHSVALSIALDVSSDVELREAQRKLGVDFNQHAGLPNEYVLITNAEDLVEIYQRGRFAKIASPGGVFSYDVVRYLFDRSIDWRVREKDMRSLTVSEREKRFFTEWIKPHSKTKVVDTSLYYPVNFSNIRIQPTVVQIGGLGNYAVQSLRYEEDLPIDYEFMRMLKKWRKNRDPTVAEHKRRALYRLAAAEPRERKQQKRIIVLLRKKGEKYTPYVTYASEAGFLHVDALKKTVNFDLPTRAAGKQWYCLLNSIQLYAFLRDENVLMTEEGREVGVFLTDEEMMILLFNFFKRNLFVCQHVEISVTLRSDQLIEEKALAVFRTACMRLATAFREDISEDLGLQRTEKGMDNFVKKVQDLLNEETGLKTSSSSSSFI